MMIIVVNWMKVDVIKVDCVCVLQVLTVQYIERAVDLVDAAGLPMTSSAVGHVTCEQVIDLIISMATVTYRLITTPSPYCCSKTIPNFY